MINFFLASQYLFLTNCNTKYPVNEQLNSNTLELFMCYFSYIIFSIFQNYGENQNALGMCEGLMGAHSIRDRLGALPS